MQNAIVSMEKPVKKIEKNCANREKRLNEKLNSACKSKFHTED